jgi:putative tricarboxylic transport membrane protein
MAQKGRAADALAISAIASFAGGLIGTIGLIMLAPVLARFALSFGPAEYFALFLLAFATLGGITGKNPMKTVIAATLGIMISTVGIDISTGLLFFVESRMGGGRKKMNVGKLTLTFKELVSTVPTQLRGGVLGFISGVLPGAGASLGSFISYTLEKSVIGKKGTFGEGDIRGVVAPEAGNNGASSGALVPMLTLGVPGSGTTAVLLAMLISLNITPGPLMFTQNADIVWGVIAALLIGNVLLLVLNIPLVGFFVRLLSVPPMYLLPIVTMVAFVGIYSISNSAFDLYFMVAFGVAGYFLRKLEIPVVPIILGLLLGPEMEKNLGHALVLSDGDWSILWESTLAKSFWLVAALSLVLPYVVGPVLRRRMNAAMKESPASD